MKIFSSAIQSEIDYLDSLLKSGTSVIIPVTFEGSIKNAKNNNNNKNINTKDGELYEYSIGNGIAELNQEKLLYIKTVFDKLVTKYDKKYVKEEFAMLHLESIVAECKYHFYRHYKFACNLFDADCGTDNLMRQNDEKIGKNGVLCHSKGDNRVRAKNQLDGNKNVPNGRPNNVLSFDDVKEKGNEPAIGSDNTSNLSINRKDSCGKNEVHSNSDFKSDCCRNTLLKEFKLVNQQLKKEKEILSQKEKTFNDNVKVMYASGLSDTLKILDQLPMSIEYHEQEKKVEKLKAKRQKILIKMGMHMQKVVKNKKLKK